MFFSRINAAVKLSAEHEKTQENEIDKKEKKDFLKTSLLKAAKKAEREARHLRSIDPTGRSFPFKQYVIACNKAEKIVKTEIFQNIVFIAILVAGILVGLQTYPGLENNYAIDVLDNIIFVIFLIEVICKIMSEGLQPFEYFIGSEWHWNNFDFFVVMLSIPFLPFQNGQVAFLRLIRLMRLAKVFRKVPQLRMIMSGLVGGLKSIVYIVILLLLVFYLYAIAGIFFFRTNDPWHFNSIAISLTTLFGIATLSNWSDIFYINYYGCEYYPADCYVLTKEEVLSTSPGAPRLCTPNAQPWLSLAYFVSFIFICSFSMLSLFVGAITVSMSESMETMKAEKEKQNKLKKIKKAEEMLQKVKDRKERRAWALVEMAFNYGKVEVVSEDISSNHYLVQIYQKIAHTAEKIVNDSRFQNFVTFIIILAGVQVGISTDLELSNQISTELFAINMIIRIIFTLECALKILAEELTPWKYFDSSWNIFDFIVVIGSYISSGGSIIVMLRLLRLLRVLKLMKMLPQLQVIVSALMSGFSSIAFISIILILFFYFFGIIAMILFRSNDPWHFGSLHMTMITLFQCATLDNWTDVLYINLYGCDMIGYEDMMEKCENPHANFLITSLFFIVFILLGALVLLALFIGVVATSMEEAADDQKQTESVDTRVAEIVKEYNLDPKHILLYREVFDALDMNGGSLIDQNEMKLGMRAAGRLDITDKQFLKLWKQVDKDGSGGIDFAEFLAFMMSLRGTTPEAPEIVEEAIVVEPGKVESRVEFNTHLITEQLYNCAAAVGPLDPTLKLDEMIKRTNTGRPNSAPRIYNRGYSLEHSPEKIKLKSSENGKMLSQRALGLFSQPSQKIFPMDSSNSITNGGININIDHSNSQSQNYNMSYIPNNPITPNNNNKNNNNNNNNNTNNMIISTNSNNFVDTSVNIEGSGTGTGTGVDIRLNSNDKVNLIGDEEEQKHPGPDTPSTSHKTPPQKYPHQNNKNDSNHIQNQNQNNYDNINEVNPSFIPTSSYTSPLPPLKNNINNHYHPHHLNPINKKDKNPKLNSQNNSNNSNNNNINNNNNPNSRNSNSPVNTNNSNHGNTSPDDRDEEIIKYTNSSPNTNTSTGKKIKKKKVISKLVFV